MLHRIGLRSALALVVSAFCLTPVGADPREAGAATCEHAIVSGAQRSKVPEGVLQAISLTETGRAVDGRLRPWPWAINREGQGYWFANRDEALAFAKQSVAEGRRSFDVGCFQINYLWHGANFASLEAMFDPNTGADYAARFLTALYGERGDWSLAAGAYHSQTPEKAQAYRAKFDRIFARLNGKPLQVADSATELMVVMHQKSRTRIKGPKIITLPSLGARPEEPASIGTTSVMRASVRGNVAAELLL